jgi:DDE superfamily endonuclease
VLRQRIRSFHAEPAGRSPAPRIHRSRRVRRQGLEPRTRGLRVAWPSTPSALPARMPPASALIALIAPVPQATRSTNRSTTNTAVTDANYATLPRAPKAEPQDGLSDARHKNVRLPTVSPPWRCCPARQHAYRGRNRPASQKEANRAHAKLRAPAERANAQLKSWRILRKLRCCPWRAGQLAKAIHILQTREIGG